jgi:hypothetical protein
MLKDTPDITIEELRQRLAQNGAGVRRRHHPPLPGPA